MKNITDINLLNEIKSNSAVFILFGSAHCSVCNSILPQLESMLNQQFPDMHLIYVDCEKSPDICAQYSVFALPVVKAYIDGMKVIEEARAFSIKQLAQKLERAYSMWKNQ